ncbi:hypothetical protein A7M79_07140 [Acinetobacter baumannii]|uniref:hypothetical protein n=1 Tax=Acinetobacter baumannii TaxID=470 RepID=UPI0008DE0528|nr:hypothetical protein [Acinetobacter baumannii]OIH08581.1 hypothetical protein A7M79_07140 [Acinetobacter baumannii]
MRSILIDLEAFPEKKSELMKSHIEKINNTTDAIEYLGGLVYLGLLKSKNNISVTNINIPKHDSGYKYKLRITDEKLLDFLDKIEKPLNRRKFIYSLIYTGIEHLDLLLNSKKSNEHEKDLFFSGLIRFYDLIICDRKSSSETRQKTGTASPFIANNNADTSLIKEEQNENPITLNTQQSDRVERSVQTDSEQPTIPSNSNLEPETVQKRLRPKANFHVV